MPGVFLGKFSGFFPPVTSQNKSSLIYLLLRRTEVMPRAFWLRCLQSKWLTQHWLRFNNLSCQPMHPPNTSKHWLMLI
jgi:hypothetical protein